MGRIKLQREGMEIFTKKTDKNALKILVLGLLVIC
jgi:hypothetical protein